MGDLFFFLSFLFFSFLSFLFFSFFSATIALESGSDCPLSKAKEERPPQGSQVSDVKAAHAPALDVLPL